jgi:hypothetical protein
MPAAGLAIVRKNHMGTSKNRLFSEVPLRFLALRAAKHAFLSGSSLKTEVFRDAHMQQRRCFQAHHRKK